MVINEIFTSIQGESTWQGYPFTFVRLTGCNLRCAYCDTKYAYEGGFEMAIDEILREVAARGRKRVLVTGGEPLIQKDTPRLIQTLIKAGYRLFLETNGTLSVEEIPRNCVKVVDMKTPGAGVSEPFLYANLTYLSGHDQIKFVITDRADFDFAKREMVDNLDPFPGTFLLSPSHGKMNPQTLARWILDEGVECMLNLQLHKLLFPGKERGI